MFSNGKEIKTNIDMLSGKNKANNDGKEYTHKKNIIKKLQINFFPYVNIHINAL